MSVLCVSIAVHIRKRHANSKLLTYFNVTGFGHQTTSNVCHSAVVARSATCSAKFTDIILLLTSFVSKLHRSRYSNTEERVRSSSQCSRDQEMSCFVVKPNNYVTHQSIAITAIDTDEDFVAYSTKLTLKNFCRF